MGTCGTTTWSGVLPLTDPQQELFGSAPVAAARGRIFLAIFPEPAIAQRAAAEAARLRQQCGLQGRPMATGRLHVSLLMIDREFEGPLPRVKVALVERVLADVEWPRTELHFDQVATLPGPRSRQPLVLLSTRPQPSLSHLFEKLVTVLADAGVAQRGEYTFLPHMTLLYDERVVEARPLEPLQWTATRFDLIHSHIGLSRYDHLASWPLPA